MLPNHIDVDEILHQNLNEAQYEAATDEAPEVLTLACAGSGKSRTLAYRIAWLIAQAENPTEAARGIVAFTFTVKAAESLQRSVARALEAVGISPMVLGAMYIGTIHSYCQFILGEMDARYRQFDVLDENRLKLYLISRYPQLGVHRPRRARGNPPYFRTIGKIADAWMTANQELLRLADTTEHDHELGEALENLSQALDEDEFLDYSLMIRLVVEALENEHPGAMRVADALEHLLVDEYQDVNYAEERLIRHLHEHTTTLFVVGDDDQAIYGWRGGNVGYILGFQNRYNNCSRHTLSINYRSTEAIVSVADGFITEVLGPNRIGKEPEAYTNNSPRDYRLLWFDTRQEEADWVASRIQALIGAEYVEDDESVRGLSPADFAILMRSPRGGEQDDTLRHAAFTEALEHLNIRYSLEAGGSIFNRPQVAVMRDAFGLLRNRPPDRDEAIQFFENQVLPAFPHADFASFANVLADWGRRIHAPRTVRRRVYPQELVHDLLNAFGIQHTEFDDPETWRELGTFSHIIQDVEVVYTSVDETGRFQQILNFLGNVADAGYATSTDDVLYRPDAVSVMSVHKAKGLEFPVVFVVDVERGRFPDTRRQDGSWLPEEVLQDALARGAYRNTEEEEARLFYTAITRPECYVYVTGCENLPNAKGHRSRSPFTLRLTHPEISDDPTGMPELAFREPRQRFDETILPTSFSEVRYYLRCPKEYQFRERYGFEPPVPALFGFGQTVHTTIERIHERFSEGTPTVDDAEEIARDTFHLKHVYESRDPDNHPGPYENARGSSVGIARSYVEEYAEDFAQRRQVEARFEIPVEQAVISGAIDLLLREDEEGNILEARVIDFKTLEEEPERPLDWAELSLQVQLYAEAAREVLDENARTGAVHLLRNNERRQVPIDEEAVDASIANIEWAVDRVIAGDFPMRPHSEKCAECDFVALCPQHPETFATDEVPPPIHTPDDEWMAGAFREFEE